MSLLSRLPALLTDVGLTEGQIVKALAESVEVSHGIIEKTKEVQEYWINESKGTGAPVSDRGPHPIMAGSSEMISPGDYVKSIKIKYEKTPILVGIVYTDAPHAHWLEYGSIHNPVYGYAQDTADHFNNAEFNRSV
jgi:hypothetical protein